MSQHPPTERPVAQPATFESAPDWTVFQDEIECPLCGYNLRGLTEARCPECGSKYEWRDLLDPNRRMHELLFEYHTGSTIKALRRTLGATREAAKFWESVHPVLPIRMDRLRLYCTLIFLAMFVSFVFGQFVIDMRSRFGVGFSMWTSFDGNVYLPWTWSLHDYDRTLATNPFFFVSVVWFLATYGSMQIFQTTMRRTRIRSAHMFRSLVYSCDRLIWLAAILILFDQMEMLGLAEMCIPFQFYAAVWFWLLIAVRLVEAFRTYLQFPNPVWTVLATQVIAALAILNIHAPVVWRP